MWPRFLVYGRKPRVCWIHPQAIITMLGVHSYMKISPATAVIMSAHSYPEIKGDGKPGHVNWLNLIIDKLMIAAWVIMLVKFRHGEDRTREFFFLIKQQN